MDLTLQKQILRGIWVAIIIALIFTALYWTIPLIYPFIIGWIIAYLFNPVVNAMQKRLRFPRWLAVTVVLLLFIGIAVAIIALLVTNIVIEITNLSKTLESSIEQWKNHFIAFVNSDFWQNLISQLQTFYNENPSYQTTINNNLTATGIKLANAGTTVIGVIFDSLISFITSLPNIAVFMIIGLLAAFFMSKDWYRWSRQIRTSISETVRKPIREVWIDLQKALFGYLRAQFILISITTVVVIIGLLVLDVNYAVTIGLLIGLVDLLPYLGTGAVFVPWIGYVFFIQNDIYLGVGLSILYGVILVARQLLEPKVLASSVGMDPLSTLIALFVGLQLFGIIGLLIGPVTLVLLTTCHRAHVFRDIIRYIVRGKRPEESGPPGSASGES